MEQRWRNPYLSRHNVFVHRHRAQAAILLFACGFPIENMENDGGLSLRLDRIALVSDLETGLRKGGLKKFRQGVDRTFHSKTCIGAGRSVRSSSFPKIRLDVLFIFLTQRTECHARGSGSALYDLRAPSLFREPSPSQDRILEGNPRQYLDMCRDSIPNSPAISVITALSLWP
jgi:hypothetical protein